MKKILLSLAALAALASCVKENNITPEQTPSGQVTIKAVAGETKTVLNGTDVVWEDGDAIKIIFNSEEKTYTSVFTTELTETSATADFTGTIDEDVTVESCGDAGYAVCPADVEIESDGQIEFTVANVQDGVIKSGANLSYAAVSLSNIRSVEETTANFHNALSLLKVTIPAGVKSVTIASKAEVSEDRAPLTGKAPFYYVEGELVVNPEKWSNSEMVSDPETGMADNVPIKFYSVALKNEKGTVLEAGTYYVNVIPGVHEGLTITVEGTDFTYSKDINAEYIFAASKYYTLNIANLFNLSESEYFVSPFGGTVELPIVTTLDSYDISVALEGDWLAERQQTKGDFRKDVVSFVAEANTTGVERTATVTISVESKILAEVTVTQKGYVPSLMNEYLESYQKNYQSYTGTLKIGETDDAAKGVYKVTVCGVTVYADYESGKLILHGTGNNEAQLDVSDDFKTISASTLELTSVGLYSIQSYKAVLPLGEAVLTEAEKALVGRYDESWEYTKSYGSTATQESSEGGMTISASDEAAYGQLKLKFLSKGGALTCYADLKNGSLVVYANGASHSSYGTAQSDITMTVTDGVLTFTSMPVALNYSYGSIDNYSATKAEASEGFSVTELLGEWSQKYATWPESTMTISNTDDPSKGDMIVKNMFYYNSYGSIYFLNCYANLESDGQTLTVLSKGIKFGSADWDGSFNENLEMVVSKSNQEIVITYSGGSTLSNMMTIDPMVATKK